jgi:hypothetical protein
MLMERTIKIVMAGGLALLCALITLGNIQDPGLNFSFVQHVLSMDTTPKNAMETHAMPFPTMWRIVFGLIVVGEGLTFSPGRRWNSCAPGKPRRGSFITPSVSSSLALVADSSSGSWASLRSAESGSRCGSLRPGTVNRPRFESSSPFSLSRCSSFYLTASFRMWGNSSSSGLGHIDGAFAL